MISQKTLLENTVQPNATGAGYYIIDLPYPMFFN
jgi:hypothetical protein